LRFLDTVVLARCYCASVIKCCLAMPALVADLDGRGLLFSPGTGRSDRSSQLPLVLRNQRRQPRLVLAFIAEENIVRKFPICLAAGAFMLTFTTPAPAFVPAQGGVMGAAATIDDTVAVKKYAKGRPYGWSRGRKVGWGRGSMPPGQRKKYWR
jgi:hypothetical protein